MIFQRPRSCESDLPSGGNQGAGGREEVQYNQGPHHYHATGNYYVSLVNHSQVHQQLTILWAQRQISS